jgi:hypothetical protein
MFPKIEAPVPCPLTAEDIRRLTLFKRRYVGGFTREQMDQLAFVRWLHQHGRL